MSDPESILPMVENLAPYSAYCGEVMLYGADWSHQAGHVAKFGFLDSDLEANPMAEHTIRRGKKAGTRFHMILIEIADDDQVVNQEQRDRVETQTASTEKGKKDRIKTAGMLATTPLFHEYLKYLGFVKDTQSRQFQEDIAAEFIRREAGIESRKELADNEAAWLRFISKVQRPYDEWFNQRY